MKADIAPFTFREIFFTNNIQNVKKFLKYALAYIFTLYTKEYGF